jgi:hypothetical protein
MNTIYAYCWSTGLIEFGDERPKGALPIAKGREEALRNLICATSRHAYDGESLLVPGVPEAKDGFAAVDALMKWCDWLAQRDTDGVEIIGCRREAVPAGAAEG